MGERRRTWWNREKSENLLQQREKLMDSPSASLRIDLESSVCADYGRVCKRISHDCKAASDLPGMWEDRYVQTSYC